jgi:hypothetical protein
MRIYYPALWCVIVLLIFSTLAKAEYSTPGSGVHYSLDSLVVHSLGAVTGGNGQYFVNASVTVSNNDTLSLSPGDTLVFTGSNGALFLEIHGALFAPGTEQDSIIITSQNKIYGDYEGINYRNTNTQSVFHLRFCRAEYAERAIDVVGGMPWWNIAAFSTTRKRRWTSPPPTALSAIASSTTTGAGR